MSFSLGAIWILSTAKARKPNSALMKESLDSCEKNYFNFDQESGAETSQLTWRNPPCSRRFLPGRSIYPPAESDSRRTWGTWSASVCPAPSGWTCPGCADYSRHTEGSLRAEQEHRVTHKSAPRDEEKTRIIRGHFITRYNCNDFMRAFSGEDDSFKSELCA